MQYLSQRLAIEPSKAPEGDRPRGTLAATQRERILAATERLIAEKGCPATTIEAIVKEAGVSSITFYEHFSDKEACFVDAFDRAVEEIRAELQEAVSAELPWPDRIRAGLHALLEAIAVDPGRARMCLVEAQKGGPRLLAHYEAALDSAVPVLREGRALDSGAGGVSETLEEAIVGGLAWLLRERLELGGGGGVEDLLPRMTEIVLSPYLGDGEAPSAVAASGNV